MISPLFTAAVQGWLHGIEKIRDDDESAHSSEDALHKAVLRQIAENSTDPDARALAALALTSRDIRFSRWCG